MVIIITLTSPEKAEKNSPSRHVVWKAKCRISTSSATNRKQQTAERTDKVNIKCRGIQTSYVPVHIDMDPQAVLYET